MVAAPRILSLIPSATDWVTAFGLADRLVGVSHECEVPGADPPVVVRPAVRHDPGDPVGVDAAVAAAAAEGRPLYEVDEAAVAGLAPTVLLTQELCDVCAVPATAVRQLASTLPGCRLVTLGGQTLEGVFDDGLQVGAALGCEGTAQRLVETLRRRLARVEAAVAGRKRPRVAFLEWPDPAWVAGHWVPDQITVAGGESLAGAAGAPSRRAEWREFARADVLVVGPCGYDLDEAAQAARALGGRVPPAGACWAVDATGMFSRPAPGLVDGVEALAGILHRDALGAPDPRQARAVEGVWPAAEPA